MNVMIFDTETTSLEKPFCYNIGYTIFDTDSDEIIAKKDYVCEQVWHNPMLFTTAYYADKRPLYVTDMRAKKTIMKKFGYICQDMIRDIKNFEIEKAFAFNSSFDEKVFAFNCDWFKCNNPFDTISVSDIRGFAHEFLVDDKFIEWADKNEKYTESGNYSTTAETMYQFISNNNEFIEDHTALSDSIIETAILKECLDKGADIHEDYKAKKSITRPIEKILTIKEKDGTEHQFTTHGYTFYKSKNLIKLK